MHHSGPGEKGNSLRRWGNNLLLEAGFTLDLRLWKLPLYTGLCSRSAWEIARVLLDWVCGPQVNWRHWCDYNCASYKGTEETNPIWGWWYLLSFSAIEIRWPRHGNLLDASLLGIVFSTWEGPLIFPITDIFSSILSASEDRKLSAL